MVKHPVPGAAKKGPAKTGSKAKSKGGADKDKPRAPAKPRPPPPPPPPMAKVDLPTKEVLDARNHFLATLGQPVHVLDLRGKKPVERLEVAVFEPPQAGAPALLASCGASVVPGAEGRVHEYVLMLKTDDRARLQKAAELVAAVAVYPVQQQVRLGPGAVIHSRDQVKAVCGLDALVALPPLPFAERFARFTRKDGKAVDLLWLVALHESEAVYADKHGIKKLYDALSAARADLAAPDRPAVKTAV